MDKSWKLPELRRPPPMGTRFRAALFCRIRFWFVDETVEVPELRSCSYRAAGNVQPRLPIYQKTADRKRGSDSANIRCILSTLHNRINTMIKISKMSGKLHGIGAINTDEVVT